MVNTRVRGALIRKDNSRSIIGIETVSIPMLRNCASLGIDVAVHFTRRKYRLSIFPGTRGMWSWVQRIEAFRICEYMTTQIADL